MLVKILIDALNGYSYKADAKSGIESFKEKFELFSSQFWKIKYDDYESILVGIMEKMSEYSYDGQSDNVEQCEKMMSEFYEKRPYKDFAFNKRVNNYRNCETTKYSKYILNNTNYDDNILIRQFYSKKDFVFSTIKEKQDVLECLINVSSYNEKINDLLAKFDLVYEHKGFLPAVKVHADMENDELELIKNSGLTCLKALDFISHDTPIDVLEEVENFPIENKDEKIQEHKDFYENHPEFNETGYAVNLAIKAITEQYYELTDEQKDLLKSTLKNLYDNDLIIDDSKESLKDLLCLNIISVGTSMGEDVVNIIDTQDAGLQTEALGGSQDDYIHND